MYHIKNISNTQMLVVKNVVNLISLNVFSYFKQYHLGLLIELVEFLPVRLFCISTYFN